ncbi:hypothetical protein Heshes_18540 [Alicyclobacillus hesperidum]|uniref:Uncharacterized protein n=1 Tax=Alicyclobacillus hesperidum TaxID=89784 RepID=A0AA37TXJ4_9BACL|nr:hypothetical protein Heshes_18540 [Alicyclobacillus hesperidum]
MAGRSYFQAHADKRMPGAPVTAKRDKLLACNQGGTAGDKQLPSLRGRELFAIFSFSLTNERVKGGYVLYEIAHWTRNSPRIQIVFRSARPSGIAKF